MLKPQGKHTCVVCTGTACYINGSADLLSALETKYDVKAGETTKDGELSVMQARCIGACGLAPAIVVDGEIHGKATPDKLLSAIEKQVHHDA
jgi:bidirectional [NiFe] hydrogenase diaphorase subunit